MGRRSGGGSIGVPGFHRSSPPSRYHPPVDHFSYRQGELYCENVRAADIANRHGTPTLVYSTAAFREGYQRFADAFTPLQCRVHFALRACPSVACLRILAKAGSGMTATSGVELERAWLSTTPFNKVLFAGPGKTDEDIRSALDGLYSPLFQAGATVDQKPPYYRGPVGRLVAESEDELERIARIAGGLRISCRVALRLDPELDAFDDVTAHPEAPPAPTGKFGLPLGLAPGLFDRYRDDPRLRLTGLHMHLGPGVVTPDRFSAGVRRLRHTAGILARAGHSIDLVDFGGGFAPTTSSDTPQPEDYASALAPLIKDWPKGDAEEVAFIVEPGRAIAAASGHLLIGVRDIKPAEDRVIVLADAGASPGRRPSARQGLVAVWPISVPPDLEPPKPGVERMDTRGMQWCDVVGPSYSARDALAEGRLMPPVRVGDALGVSLAGAYARDTLAPLADDPTPSEVLVDGFQTKVLRPRPSAADRIRPEADAMHTFSL